MINNELISAYKKWLNNNLDFSEGTYVLNYKNINICFYESGIYFDNINGMNIASVHRDADFYLYLLHFDYIEDMLQSMYIWNKMKS